MPRADGSGEPEGRGKRIRRILSLVLLPNLIVAAAKLGYGFISGSVGMSADGFHSLLDAFANVVGTAAAVRHPDRDHHFGHGRYETLAPMAIGARIVVGVFEIVQSTVERLKAGEAPEVTKLSFVVMRSGTMPVQKPRLSCMSSRWSPLTPGRTPSSGMKLNIRLTKRRDRD
jgi:divalent metal cation (Fe/Co/Zn/Cd) transporter